MSSTNGKPHSSSPATIITSSNWVRSTLTALHGITVSARLSLERAAPGSIRLITADTWPFREAYNLYQHGVLKIELKLDSYSWSFLPVVKTTSGDKIATKGGMKVIKNVTGAVCNRVKP